MREAGGVVAQNQRIANPRTPPLVFIRKPDIDGLCRYQRRRLAEVESPDRVIAKAHGEIDRKRSGIVWQIELASPRRNRRRVESAIEERPLGVVGEDQLGREDYSRPRAFQLVSEQGSRAYSLARPHRAVVLGKWERGVDDPEKLWRQPVTNPRGGLGAGSQRRRRSQQQRLARSRPFDKLLRPVPIELLAGDEYERPRSLAQRTRQRGG